jgi:hypothetical protein
MTTLLKDMLELDHPVLAVRLVEAKSIQSKIITQTGLRRRK